MIASGAEENNHGPANIGQAKHMAKSALDTLRPILPDVAAQIEADLAPILSFSVPDPKTPEWIEKQKAPLLIGQLKAIAAPFYTRLNAAAPAWLENQRNTSGTSSPNSIFPWTEGVGDDQNKAIANIGQLKAVFSLDLDKLPTDLSTLDTDDDGLPDHWEFANRIDPLDNGSGNVQNGPDGSFTAPNGSVITNAQALAQGLGGGGENQIIPTGSASFAAITFPESEVAGVSQVFPIAVNNDASVLLVSELGKKPRAMRWNAGNTEELLFSKQELFDEYFDAEDGQWPEFPRPVDLNNQGVVLATPTWAFLDKEEDDEEGFWINDFVHWPPPPATISVSIPMIVNLPASSLLEKELPGLRLLGSVLNDGSEYLLTNLDDQGSYFFLAPSMHYQSNLVFDVDYEGNKSYPSIQVGTTFKVGITESAGSSSIPLLAQIGTRHHVQDSEGRQTISGIIKQVLATSPDGTKRVIISEDSENPRTPPSVGPTSTLTLEGGGADLTDFPKVHKDLYSVNNAGVLIGSTGADTRVSNGTDQFTLPGLPVAISSPSDTTTPLVILTQTHYYSQKKNPESGDLLPADKAANFDATPFKKLPTLAAWTDVTLTDMSDDGSLIVGHGNLHNLDAEGNRTEPPIGKRGFLLLPVEVVELSPKLRDETGAEIADSDQPRVLPQANGMVEEDPANDRIAHRELKVQIGKPLEGKKVSWSMEARFTPNGASEPNFRGDWATAAQAHRNRFEASTTYGNNDYRTLSQEEGETTVDSNGFTAIRVNVPPWGLNMARISIQIEGTSTPIELIDLEVLGVIVIDPGHGIGAAGSSNAIGGAGDTTQALEHEFALDIGTRMAADLRARRDAEQLPIKVYMTRTGTGNISFPDRTRVARENGCDVYVSIHFNDVSSVPLRRHPFGMWDATGNENEAEDQALAIRLRQAVQTAIAAVEPEDSRDAATDGITSETHEVNLQKGLDTCSDSTNSTTPNYNGNIPGHTPCRAALIELEWMSNEKADPLFNEGNANLTDLADQMREEAAQAMADATIEDLYAEPAP